ncbi:MAG TPA: ferrochelatase [Actinomycetota bacterium]|nr:ferrochelatase [Actinomycetota bacterium]
MSSPAPVGVLVMAYGTASGPDDIERYYTDIRGGRAPSPGHLQELRDRYAAIGNVFPLVDTTRAQAAGLVERLDADAPQPYRAYLGMKHSPPFIPDAVGQMMADGITRAVGIVMAPHWSGMSVETYIERTLQAIDAQGSGLQITFVRSFHEHPMFVAFLAGRLRATLATLDAAARERLTVLFTAHSLPVRTADDGTLRCKTCDCDVACRYRDGLATTGDLVSAAVGVQDHRIAWQSVGRTADPWWGPGVDEVIPELAAQRRSAVVVCCAGFVADHLETLYDLDIDAARQAAEAGIAFARTPMPNADPAFLDVLAAVVRDHLVSTALAG